MADHEWFDVTTPFAEATPEWPGDTAMHCGWTMEKNKGDSVNLSTVTFSPHVGTHADSPLHVNNNGKDSSSIPLYPFSGPALVVDVSDKAQAIDEATILDCAKKFLNIRDSLTRLILRSRASITSGAFPAEWPWLHEDTARRLTQSGLCLLATDAPSIDERNSKLLTTHHACFDNGAWVLENLDLTKIEQGLWEIRALPMKISGLDAAPVRALMRPIRTVPI